MSKLIGRNIKIVYKKKDNNIDEKYYITKDEFKSVKEDVVILKYIKLMKKMKNINNIKLMKNIYEILFEISSENVDINDMKTFVNKYYKYVKIYKNHMICFNKSGDNIIKFYEDLFESKKLNVNILRYILHLLYNEGILSKECIIKWYNNLDEDSKFLESTLLNDFMDWLENNSDSESEELSEDDSD